MSDKIKKSKNNRQSDRLDHDLPVQLQVNGALLSGLMKNISCGGIFVESPSSPDLFEDMEEVILHLPNNEHPLKVASELVWSGPPSSADSSWGLGIKFLDMLPDDERLIQAFLESNNKENVN